MPISVLTLTYQRHHLLEEAIASFLLQKEFEGSEMVVINDSPDVKYIFDHPKVRIINLDHRFDSIGEKLEWGYKQCKNDYIYRLDDDDLLTEDALSIATLAIYPLIYNIDDDHKLYDIYRSQHFYYFSENQYDGFTGSTNNGNIYSKDYLDRIIFPKKSFGEDLDITFGNDASIYTINLPTMIYRWGMNTYHVSGMGNVSNEEMRNWTDSIIKKEEGEIILQPHFKEDYYSKIKTPLK
jgi:glycosyltransferase involved in cell wall biosynthesis